MKEIILIKLGEIVLKGLNRQSFEFALIRNLRRRLEPLGKFDIREAQSTIYVEPWRMASTWKLRRSAWGRCSA